MTPPEEAVPAIRILIRDIVGHTCFPGRLTSIRSFETRDLGYPFNGVTWVHCSPWPAFVERIESAQLAGDVQDRLCCNFGRRRLVV